MSFTLKLPRAKRGTTEHHERPVWPLALSGRREPNAPKRFCGQAERSGSARVCATRPKCFDVRWVGADTDSRYDLGACCSLLSRTGCRTDVLLKAATLEVIDVIRKGHRHPGG